MAPYALRTASAGIRTLSTSSVFSPPTKLRCRSPPNLRREYEYSTETVRMQYVFSTEIRAHAVGSTESVRISAWFRSTDLPIESTDHLISWQHFVFAVPPFYHAEAEEAEAVSARRTCCCCITRIGIHARRRPCIAGIAGISVNMHNKYMHSSK